MLTKAHDSVLQLQIEATHEGMAYWACTGPGDRCCHECAHWGATEAKSGPTYKRNEAGVLKPKRCHLYSMLNGGQRCSTGVPASTQSCKYFVIALSPPPFFKDPKP